MNWETLRQISELSNKRDFKRMHDLILVNLKDCHGAYLEPVMRCIEITEQNIKGDRYFFDIFRDHVAKPEIRNSGSWIAGVRVGFLLGFYGMK